jgi:hypothetical protein
MAVTSDEIDTLRKSMSDDDILGKLKDYAPDDAKDIEQLQKGGMKSGDILDKYTQYHQQFPDAPERPAGGTLMDGLSKAGAAIKYGIAGEAARMAATGKNVFGTDGKTMGAIADSLSDPSYDPAMAHVGKGELSYLPRALLEGAGATGGYLLGGAAAAAAAPEVAGAGLIGAGAYGLSRYLGTNAQERAKNDGRETATSGDVLHALPGSAAQALVDAAGSRYLAGNAILGEAPVVGAGLQAMKQTGLNVAKAGAANAIAGGASTALEQAGTEIGTKAGYRPDLQQIGESALAGGLVGAGTKGVMSVPESIMNIRQTNTDPHIRNELADDFNGDRISGNPNDPKDYQRLLQNGKAVIGQDARDHISDIQSQVSEIEKANKAGAKDSADLGTPHTNQPTGHLTDAVDTAENLLTNLKTGKLDPEQVSKIHDELGDHPELQKALLKLNELHNLAEQGKVHEGGAPTPSAFDLLHLAKYSKNAMGAAGLAGAATGHYALGAALYGIPVLASIASRLKAGIVGDRDFISQYAKRFGNNADGGMPTAPPGSVAPPPDQSAPPTQPSLDSMALPLRTQLAAASALAKQKQKEMGVLAQQEAAGRDADPVSGLNPGQQQAAAAQLAAMRTRAHAKMAEDEFNARNAPPEQAPEAPDAISGLTQAQQQTNMAALALQKQRAMGQIAAQEHAQRLAEQHQVPAPEPEPTVGPLGLNQRQVEMAKLALAKQRQAGMTRMAAEEYAQRMNPEQEPVPTSGPLGLTDTQQSSAAANLGLQRQRAMAKLAAHEHAQRAKAAKGGGTAKAAKAPKAEKTTGGSGHSSEHVHTDSVTIHTKEGTKVQEKSQIRKQDGGKALGVGVESRRGARRAILEQASGLSGLSKAGKLKAKGLVGSTLSDANSTGTNNRQAGDKVAQKYLSHFEGKDRARLEAHLTTAQHNGMTFRDSWRHETPEAAEKARGKNESTHKANVTKLKKVQAAE